MTTPLTKRAAFALALLAGTVPALARRAPGPPRLPAAVRQELGRWWEVRTVDSTADLDRDGRRDLLVIAVETTMPIDSSDGRPWNPNTWRLMVALRQPGRGRWKVVVDNPMLIPPPLSAFQMEPFNSIETDTGRIEVELCHTMIAGTWETSTSNLEFQWRDSTFVLTRWKRNDGNRGSGLSITTTVDLPSGDVHQTIEPGDTDSLGTRDSVWAIPPQQGPSLSGIDDGLQYRPGNLDQP